MRKMSEAQKIMLGAGVFIVVTFNLMYWMFGSTEASFLISMNAIKLLIFGTAIWILRKA